MPTNPSNKPVGSSQANDRRRGVVIVGTADDWVSVSSDITKFDK